MAVKPTQAEYLASVRDAADNANVGMDDTVNEDAKERAATAGVKHAFYIDYAAGLDNYEARADVESLAHRRAREAQVDDPETDFARADDYEGE